MAEQYKQLQAFPAWQHYQGMVLGLKNQIENGILTGVMEEDRDLTPQYRAIYGVLLQILALPAQIETKKIAAEYDTYLRDDLGESAEPLDNL